MTLARGFERSDEGRNIILNIYTVRRDLSMFKGNGKGL